MWALKEYLRKIHGITNAVQLQAFIKEKLGVIVTVQTLRTLLRSSPAAPRAEMIQLLCDTFNCRSDAFYVFTPNQARTQQWERDKTEGKEPSPYYQPKVHDPAGEFVMPADTSVESGNMGKPTSLRSTFTDPRTLYKERLGSRE
ncbi:MAG TPA: hypothetical protein VEW46_00675 [Pyrinomonadaceae bacterium]|nr:hypothetical protein [Pyrinomonadaceae bacterium]